jgi:hypothetical protein
LAAFLALSAFSACFDTQIIPERAGQGGMRTGGAGGSPDSAGAAAAGEEAGASASGGAHGGASGGGQPNAGAGGTALGGATTGGKSASGGASGGKGGTMSAGGVSTTGGAAGGGSGGQATPKLDWLSFEGSAAPAAQSPNAALGVDGLLYAYGDSCAALEWDPVSRCATGSLCESQNGLNWGIAVGFDFRNTGPTGTPPDTKLLWNPNDFGAQGIAWELTGTAPKFQVWVLNMDKVWNGQCNSTACDIAGPPDGAATPSLLGQLLFSNMMKDDWGGSGLVYEYDPAKVYALQLKLPAIIAGPVSFSFCVKRVGIIH